MKVIFRCQPGWESYLLRPALSRQALPEWLKQMPAKAHNALMETDLRTAKQCPPLIDAMSTGFTVFLAADVHIKNGQFSWQWDLPPARVGRPSRAPVSFHFPEQTLGTPFESENMFIKFNNFWTIELEPGYSLFVLHPVNQKDLPFQTLSGLVDADLFKYGLIHFPAVWKDPTFEGLLKRGTPIAQCLIIKRTPLDLKFGTLEGPAADKYREVEDVLEQKPGGYRRHFRDAERE